MFAAATQDHNPNAIKQLVREFEAGENIAPNAMDRRLKPKMLSRNMPQSVHNNNHSLAYVYHSRNADAAKQIMNAAKITGMKYETRIFRDAYEFHKRAANAHQEAHFALSNNKELLPNSEQLFAIRKATALSDNHIEYDTISEGVRKRMSNKRRRVAESSGIYSKAAQMTSHINRETQWHKDSLRAVEDYYNNYPMSIGRQNDLFKDARMHARPHNNALREYDIADSLITGNKPDIKTALIHIGHATGYAEQANEQNRIMFKKYNIPELQGLFESTVLGPKGKNHKAASADQSDQEYAAKKASKPSKAKTTKTSRKK